MRWRASSKAALAAMAAAALAAGCSKPAEYVPVEGRVFYKDRELISGVIMFQPISGPPARGDIGPDGKFRLTTPGRGDGAHVGPNKVRISSREAPAGDKTEIALGRSITPLRYADFESSGLVADVKAAGNGSFEFRLTDD